MIKNYTSNNCTFYFNDVKAPNPNNTICNELWNNINNLWQGLNWYDLFRKVYPNMAETDAIDDLRTKTVIIGGEEKTYKVGFTFQEYTRWLDHMPLY